ncbi:DUF3626 domain-containing protein [Ornithinimicrobium ciconiae]|uniref:DUF3626 domain-containing protein n=1 Tax=Ornithinimicrobium ciconiae TaxID=2594265 RepID=A0A516G9E6_9MICO|nr:DUF3626 domain-containing protein [Ornithinimicrobium ciconiae]QDO87980.1 DUF3626 domain-containing protein [Ornithinimicrobium ciconiae]
MHVTLQFHPDWPHRDEMVIESIVRDGVYLSQFETGTSNGGLTAHQGGNRWRWESRLFGGRYDRSGPRERPVYGALNFDDGPYGASVRFGSAHLRLRPDVNARSTFCYPDSVFEPDAVRGFQEVEELVDQARTGEHDLLDRYVEAHVHGGVSISRDVEAVVLDPCFRGTTVEEAAQSLGCPVEWHPGFEVASSSLDPDYRGPQFVALARALGRVVTPDLIGEVARSRQYDPQALKRVWHYLARFGQQTLDDP